MKTVRWFVRGDLDGFFGLFVDNLLQLMLIVVLSGAVCGLPTELVVGTILPGAAISILVGNLFYSWQAARVARREGRDDVTALPYGINTPSLVGFVFFVMGPIYQNTKDAQLAWHVGLFACLMSALIEIAGAFVGGFLRRHTPRAALLCALAGVAVTFISMGFIFQIFASPAIALVPMFLILITYASGIRLPLGLPGGLVAILVGTAIAWVLKINDLTPAPPSPPIALGWVFPKFLPGDAIALITDPRAWGYIAIILPMGLFNVIGSLQNLESAEAAGDRFPTRSSLLANGIGSLAAACFGSPFPTTIYIGHPGWKSMGARIGYSALNGVVIFLLCLSGGVLAVLNVIPIEATLGILLWIGIIIMAQAFRDVPQTHTLAVAIGLIPALAAWAVFLVETSVGVAGTTLFHAAPIFGQKLHVYGMIALSQGFILTATIYGAILVHVIERQFRTAAVWACVAAVLSTTGLIHAYVLTPTGILKRFGWNESPQFTFAYLGVAAVLVAVSFLKPNLAPEAL
jgi:AGZA family xanthine/uracil permease-like MFS transporter